MKSQPAGPLVGTHSRPPTGKTRSPEGIPRHAHAAADRAELFVLCWIKETFLIVRIEKLTNHLPFAPQGKENHHERNDECWPHDQKISRKEKSGSSKRRGTIPGCVHQDREHVPEHRHRPLYESVLRLPGPAKPNA